jgi:hypothetical protein
MGSPTIDEQKGTVYFATGNPDPNAPSSCASPYTEAVIEVNATDLSLVGSYQVRGSDNADLDFGSTPTLFQASGNNMVGVVNKDGTFYAFQRDALASGTIWRAKIGNGGNFPQAGSADISPAAWDGRKVDPVSGNFIWQTCLQDGPVLGAVTVADGVAYLGEGTHFVAIDTSSGKIDFNYDTGSLIWGAASVSNGVVYVGNQGGTLYAFGL